VAALTFIIDTIIVIFLLRFLLQLTDADGRNIFSLWISKLTAPVLRIVEYILPARHRINWPCLFVVVLLKALVLCWLIWQQVNAMPHLGGLVLLTFAQLLYLTCNIFFVSLILQAILSWVAVLGGRVLPIYDVVANINSPLLSPIQRVVPLLGGVDLSPIIALLAIQLIKFYVLGPVGLFAVQLLFTQSN
jgi:YggT family protein